MATGIFFNTKRERDAYHAAGGEFDYDEPKPFRQPKATSHKVTRLKQTIQCGNSKQRGIKSDLK